MSIIFVSKENLLVITRSDDEPVFFFRKMKFKEFRSNIMMVMIFYNLKGKHSPYRYCDINLILATENISHAHKLKWY